MCGAQNARRFFCIAEATSPHSYPLAEQQALEVVGREIAILTKKGPLDVRTAQV